MSTVTEKQLAPALFLLRLGIFVVMFVWTLDKFINPDHSGRVFERFYGIGDLSPALFTGLGVLQLILVFAFLAGIRKRISYALVALLHAGSTLSTWELYLDPFNNLLFFAAWPMLAACIALYMLRDADSLFTVSRFS